MTADAPRGLPSRVGVILSLDTLDVMGGVQRVVGLLAPALAAADVPVGVVALRRERDRPVPTLQPDDGIARVALETEPATMPYSPLPLNRALRLLARGNVDAVRTFRAGVRELRRILSRLDDPVVLCMQLQSAEYWIAAGLPPERLVVQWHGSFEQAQNFRELARIRWVSRRAAATLALNAGDAGRFTAAGVRTTGWIRNPVDVGALSHPEAEKHPRDRRIVAAGRFVEEKGYDLLLQAWSRIADRHADWELVIHGEGPLRDTLVRLVDDARAAGVQVRLCPPTDDLPALLRRSSVHVLPSRVEGMGLVLAEAMCCGTPNIAFDCSAGVHELLADGAGVLVPPKDVASLAEALSALIDDPSRRDAVATAGRTRIGEFGLERATRSWLEIIDQIAGTTFGRRSGTDSSRRTASSAAT